VVKSLSSVQRYPDITGKSLRTAIGKRLALSPDQIVVGSGSGDLLQQIILGLGDPDSEIIVPDPSFPPYLFNIRKSGARTVRIPLTPSGAMDLVATAQSITPSTSLVLLCNPNNPTGGMLPPEQFIPFLSAVPKNVVVLVDEAYWELSTAYLQGTPGLETVLQEFPQLILLRTFSKYFRMAGMRVGYALAGSPDLAGEIRSHLSQVIVSHPAFAAAEAAWECEPLYRAALPAFHDLRRQCWSRLKGWSLEPLPSETNFIAFRWPWPREVFREHNIAARPGETMGLPGYVRLTLGLPSEMDYVMAFLEEWVAHASVPETSR
jgi:histidinol-phosphate aminotransferase